MRGCVSLLGRPGCDLGILAIKTLPVDCLGVTLHYGYTPLLLFHSGYFIIVTSLFLLPSLLNGCEIHCYYTMGYSSLLVHSWTIVGKGK